MRNLPISVAIVAALNLPFFAVQAQDDAPETYVYATYSVCDLSRQERADEIVEKIEKPIYDKAVSDGEISGWGWFAHHTGGNWRRLSYHMAPTPEALLDAQEKISERLDKKDAKAGEEMAKICTSHDDYIWKMEAGSAPSEDAGQAMFSVYFICEETREGRADEIVKSAFAPIFDRYVKEGKLTSWGWLSHQVGGKYRRIQTLAAKDVKSVLKARNEILEEIYPEDSATGEEFTSICGSHSDYIWMKVAGK